MMMPATAVGATLTFTFVVLVVLDDEATESRCSFSFELANPFHEFGFDLRRLIDRLLQGSTQCFGRSDQHAVTRCSALGVQLLHKISRSGDIGRILGDIRFD